jgi:hypothetical protein
VPIMTSGPCQGAGPERHGRPCQASNHDLHKGGSGPIAQMSAALGLPGPGTSRCAHARQFRAASHSVDPSAQASPVVFSLRTHVKDMGRMLICSVVDNYTMSVLMQRNVVWLRSGRRRRSAAQEHRGSRPRVTVDVHGRIGTPAGPLSGTARIGREGRVNNGNPGIGQSKASRGSLGSRPFDAMKPPIRASRQSGQNGRQNGAFRGR